MGKIILTTFVALLVAFSTNAQGNLFRVMVCNNSFVQGDTLLAFDHLKAGQSITIKEDGYVALIHTSGVPLELKDVGIYKIDSLSKSLTSKGTSFSAKYSEYLLNNFADKVESEKSYDQVGGVTRGGPYKIYVYSPANFKVVAGIPIDIHWKAAEPTDTYEFSLMDLSDEVLFNKETTKTFVEVDFGELPIEASKHYILKVYSKEKQKEIYSRKIRIDVVSESEASELIQLHDQVVAEINQRSAFDNMMLASFYDSKGLSIYAASCLHHAVELEPKVKDFEKAYRKYLGMNGMLPEQQ